METVVLFFHHHKVRSHDISSIPLASAQFVDSREQSEALGSSQSYAQYDR